jgi:hypothetical protein
MRLRKALPLTKREWVLLAVLAVLIVAVTFRPPAPINEATYNRIRQGMTLEEASSVIGRQPGDYTSGPVELAPDAEGIAVSWTGGSVDHGARWEGDTGMIIVYFHQGKANGKWFTRYQRVPQGPLERLRWRFERWQMGRIRDG